MANRERQPPRESRYRVGVDIGGTFTDIVFLNDEGTLFTKKVSSSVEDYARAIVEGLEEVYAENGVGASDVEEVLHATTVVSNAILEYKGARTGLITTRGFRDVLELRRLRMPRLYDLAWEKPPPLVERYLRMEVTERLDEKGGHRGSPRRRRCGKGSRSVVGRRHRGSGRVPSPFLRQSGP